MSLRPVSSSPSKIARNRPSRSANVCTRWLPPKPSSNSLLRTRSDRKSMNASALASMSSRFSRTSAKSSTSVSPHTLRTHPDLVGVRAQRVEVHPVRLEGRVVAYSLERLRRDAEALVAPPVPVIEGPRAIEEAEIGALHVEAQRGHPALVGREVLEDGGEQEFDRARLGREPRHAGDVQVRSFGAEQEVGVQVDGRLEARRRVEADRNPASLRPRP